jgi:hypothetical protein
MRREDDEELWELLGRAAEYKPSPFFARNVLRQIRQTRDTTGTVRAWLSWRSFVSASAALAAIVAGILALQHPMKPQSQPGGDPDVVAKIDPQDYEVVADLDDLLATDDNGVWEDNSNSTL